MDFIKLIITGVLTFSFLYIWLWRSGKVIGIYRYIIKEKLYRKPFYIILSIVLIPLLLLMILICLMILLKAMDTF